VERPLVRAVAASLSHDLPTQDVVSAIGNPRSSRH
jgi:hypothetical protein